LRAVSAKTLGGLELINLKQCVLLASVPDSALVELPRQPLSAVDVDLNLEREPTLDPAYAEGVAAILAAFR
jgi:hypothetical protein